MCKCIYLSRYMPVAYPDKQTSALFLNTWHVGLLPLIYISESFRPVQARAFHVQPRLRDWWTRSVSLLY